MLLDAVCKSSYVNYEILFAGPHTFSLPWQYRLAGAGKALPGASTRMRNVDSTGCGEVASLVYTLKVYPVIVLTICISQHYQSLFIILSILTGQAKIFVPFLIYGAFCVLKYSNNLMLSHL